MKYASLVFPDIHTLADFVRTEHVKQAKVDPYKLVLKGRLSELQIALACTQYLAYYFLSV